ncbi:unnamed protein product [Rotaria sordida]|uniref:VASt domain-containing protein n=1 Tax=Rotaria sordida TaxID=392033 RepID=A0A819CKN8_9BILA|nr:unnamed protein product [Rotaria sordida]
MDTIRLFLRSNSFRNLRIKNDFNNEILPIRSNIINIEKENLLIENEKNQILTQRNSSSEKLSSNNIKSFSSTDPSSSSFSSNSPIVSSNSLLNNTKHNNIVANASSSSSSSSISNVRSFTYENSSKERRHKKQRRHSSIVQQNLHHLSSLSYTMRRTKSYRIRKYSTEKIKHRIIQVNHSTKSVSFPLSTNINNQLFPISSTQIHSVKTTTTNAFLTAAAILKYWPFQSTYRQRNEEFRKVFKDVPNDERLIVDYSCAWQKEILIQGRMYISQNYLCFYANFLKWETSLCLKFKDIIGVTREKTAKVIPNAIEVRTNKNEKYFFASFATRDKTYAMIFRIWQTVLIDQPISSQQLWNMIHQCYGDDLDMTTDEEDTYNKQSISSTSEKNSPIQQTKNETNDKYCGVTPNSVCSKSSEKEELDDHSSVSSCGGRQIDDDSYNDIDDNQNVIPIGEEANSNTLIRQSNSNINKQDNCFISMAIVPETNYLSKCSCQSHLATQLIDRTYSISVERLFDYLFGDNDFVVAYHASRRIKDYNATEWKVNEKTGKRERLCTYKVDVSAVFGATTICSNEKQIIQCELSKSHYIIDTEVRNEGIKYADAFFIASRYCLIQTGPNKSHLKVTCEVRYLRSLMIIIKSFIEKNAMAALQDSYTDLNNRIELSTSTVKRMEVECSRRQRRSSTTINNEQDKENQLKKKHSQKQQSIKLNSTINDSSPHQQRKQATHNETIHHTQNAKLVLSSSSNCLSSSEWSKSNVLIPFCFIIMLILVSVNIFLCIKLNEIDQMTDRLSKNYPLWSYGYPYPKEEYQWSLLLKRQEEYYQAKLTGLHSILISTHNALKNVTDALNELTKVSRETSSNAPINHLHSL